MKKIVVGDLHLKEQEPYYSQTRMFLDWLGESELNTENNDLLLLGDLCDVNATPELLGVYVDYFVNKFKFKKITILQGNHDCSSMSTILSVFEPLRNIEIITDYTTEKLHNMNLLYLPYYHHEGTSKKSMVDLYSTIEDTNIYKYAFGHIEDDTQHFSTKYPSTNHFKVENWMNGHIHTSDIQKGGHYLGSPVLCSYTESGKKPYIASIDYDTTEYELIEVPKFLEYYDVSYPNDLPKINTPLALFWVKDSLDKQDTVDFYTRKAKEKGYDFYSRLITKKKIRNDDTEIERDTEIKSDEEYFNDFAKNVKLSENVKRLCMEILKC